MRVKIQKEKKNKEIKKKYFLEKLFSILQEKFHVYTFLFYVWYFQEYLCIFYF